MSKYTKTVNPNFYKKIKIEPRKGPELMESGCINVPWVLETKTKSSPEYDEFMEKYRKDHEVCPVCGSNHYLTTLMGYMLNMNNKEAYKDLNNIVCQKCGFKGTAHDLIRAASSDLGERITKRRKK